MVQLNKLWVFCVGFPHPLCENILALFFYVGKLKGTRSTTPALILHYSQVQPGNHIYTFSIVTNPLKEINGNVSLTKLKVDR